MNEENSQQEAREIHDDIETLKLALQAAGNEYEVEEESGDEEGSRLRGGENWGDPGEGTSADPGVLYTISDNIEDDRTELSADLGLDEGELPANPRTCLALNLAYQEIINENLKRIELVLAHNRERQSQVREEMESRSKERSGTTSAGIRRVQTMRFPYFKDKDGMVPPMNEETKNRGLLLSSTRTYQTNTGKQTKPWTKEEEKCLLNCVKRDTLQRAMRPAMNMREIEITKLNESLPREEKEKQQLLIDTLEQMVSEARTLIEELESRKPMVDEEEMDELMEKITELHEELEVKEAQLANEQHKAELCKYTKEEVEERIAQLDREIDRKKRMPVAELLGSYDRTEMEEVDWMKISSVDFDGQRSARTCFLMWANLLHPAISREPWSKQEEDSLRVLAESNSCRHWDLIAQELGTNRTGFMCMHRYQSKLNPCLDTGKWLKDEDEFLQEVVESVRDTRGDIEWSTVAYNFEGRTAEQCMERWEQVYGRVNRGRWTEAEDTALINAVKRMGTYNWSSVADYVKTRTANQCRNRWVNHLQPELKMGNWSYKEDKILWTEAKKCIRDAGHINWQSILKRLPGRTTNQLLQRYRRMQDWEKLEPFLKGLSAKVIKDLSENTTRLLIKERNAEERKRLKESTRKPDPNDFIVYKDKKVPRNVRKQVLLKELQAEHDRRLMVMQEPKPLRIDKQLSREETLQLLQLGIRDTAGLQTNVRAQDYELDEKERENRPLPKFDLEKEIQEAMKNESGPLSLPGGGGGFGLGMKQEGEPEVPQELKDLEQEEDEELPPLDKDLVRILERRKKAALHDLEHSHTTSKVTQSDLLTDIEERLKDIDKGMFVPRAPADKQNSSATRKFISKVKQRRQIHEMIKNQLEASSMGDESKVDKLLRADAKAEMPQSLKKKVNYLGIKSSVKDLLDIKRGIKRLVEEEPSMPNEERDNGIRQAIEKMREEKQAEIARLENEERQDDPDYDPGTAAASETACDEQDKDKDGSEDEDPMGFGDTTKAKRIRITNEEQISVYEREQHEKIDAQIMAFFQLGGRKVGRPRKEEKMDHVGSTNSYSDQFDPQNAQMCKVAQLMTTTMKFDLTAAQEKARTLREECRHQREKMLEQQQKEAFELQLEAVSRVGRKRKLKMPGLCKKLKKNRLIKKEPDEDINWKEEADAIFEQIEIKPLAAEHDIELLEAVGGPIDPEVAPLDQVTSLGAGGLPSLFGPDNCDTPSQQQKPKARRKFRGEAANVYNIPPLPPNCATLTAFKRLLLSRKYLVTKAQHLVSERTSKRKRALQKKDPLEPIRQTHDYNMLKARFQSLFLWPALVSAIPIAREKRILVSEKELADTAAKDEEAAAASEGAAEGGGAGRAEEVAGGDATATQQVQPSFVPLNKPKRGMGIGIKGKRKTKMAHWRQEEKEAQAEVFRRIAINRMVREKYVRELLQKGISMEEAKAQALEIHPHLNITRKQVLLEMLEQKGHDPNEYIHEKNKEDKDSFLAFQKNRPRGRDTNLRRYYRCLVKSVEKSKKDKEKVPRNRRKIQYVAKPREVPKRASAAKLGDGWACKKTPIGIEVSSDDEDKEPEPKRNFTEEQRAQKRDTAQKPRVKRNKVLIAAMLAKYEMMGKAKQEADIVSCDEHDFSDEEEARDIIAEVQQNLLAEITEPIIDDLSDEEDDGGATLMAATGDSQVTGAGDAMATTAPMVYTIVDGQLVPFSQTEGGMSLPPPLVLPPGDGNHGDTAAGSGGQQPLLIPLESVLSGDPTALGDLAALTTAGGANIASYSSTVATTTTTTSIDHQTTEEPDQLISLSNGLDDNNDNPKPIVIGGDLDSAVTCDYGDGQQVVITSEEQPMDMSVAVADAGDTSMEGGEVLEEQVVVEEEEEEQPLDYSRHEEEVMEEDEEQKVKVIMEHQGVDEVRMQGGSGGQ